VPGSTMTNATVATTVVGKDGQNLLVKYKNGEKNVVVPPNTPATRRAVPPHGPRLKIPEFLTPPPKSSGRNLVVGFSYQFRILHPNEPRVDVNPED
jgi:hypothetical protein